MLRKNIQMVTLVRGILDGFFASFIPSICTQTKYNQNYLVVLTTIKIGKYMAQLESSKILFLSICNLRKLFMEYLAQLESSKISATHLQQFAKNIHGIFNATGDLQILASQALDLRKIFMEYLMQLVVFKIWLHRLRICEKYSWNI